MCPAWFPKARVLARVRVGVRVRASVRAMCDLCLWQPGVDIDFAFDPSAPALPILIETVARAAAGKRAKATATTTYILGTFPYDGGRWTSTVTN